MALADIDVRALVEQHKRGDTEAFDEIVRRHAPRLLAHAQYRLRDLQAAEDAVQETFLRAYRAMPRFEGDFHLQAWLHRICTNVCYDELDRRRRHGLAEDKLTNWVGEPGEADLEEEFQTAAVSARLSDALAQIPGQYREALVLHYGEDLSFREIAQRTGVTEENARARASRGRRALRRIMAAPMALLGFLVPALRKGERAAQAAEIGSTSGADPVTVAHTTSFVNQVAPTMARVAADVGPAAQAKAQIITGAVAAATSVAVPVAATQVIDRTHERTPIEAASAPTTVAAPLGEPEQTVVVIPVAPPVKQATATTVAVAPVSATPGAVTATTVASGSSVPVTIDPPVPGEDDGADGQLTATTVPGATTVPTTTPTTAPVTTVPPILPGPASVSVNVSGSVTGTRWDIAGSVSLTPDGGSPLSVSVSGVADITEGATSADPDRLRLSLSGGGVSLVVQARGTYDPASGTFAISQGKHSTTTPAGSGITASGDASGSLALAGGTTALRLT